jgi:two-component system chemotaxis sensor kinase CheA
MADTVDSLAKTIDDLGGRAMLVDDEPVELASLTQALAKLAKGAESAGCDELAQAALNLSCGASSGDDLRHGLSQMQKILEAEAAKVSDNPATRFPPAPLGLDPELLNDFIVEARDHLTTIETKVLALELDPDEIEAVHAIFRGFHTIKGLAGFLDLPSIQAVAHEVETLLDQVRTGQLGCHAGDGGRDPGGGRLS